MKQPRLKERGIIPHGGGFKITDPMTGVEVFGLLFNQLVPKMKAVRKANGIPIGLEFESEVETWACMKYPAECEDADPDIPRARTLSLSDIIRGTRVILELKLSGSKLVDRTEAERRGAICQNCPMNVKFSKPCSGVCPELQSLVTSIVGNQGTHYDQFLHSCSICSCYNAAQIWVPLQILESGVTEQMKRQFANVPGCWKQV